MPRAAHRPSSGAPNCTCSLRSICPYGDRPLPRLSGHSVPTQPWQRPVTIWAYRPEAAGTVWSSWWWALCRSRHVDPLKNFGMINPVAKLHLVGVSAESCRLIYCSLLAQHVSSDIFAHHQEHLDCICSIWVPSHLWHQPAATLVNNTGYCIYSQGAPDDEGKYRSKHVQLTRNNKLI